MLSVVALSPCAFAPALSPVAPAMRAAAPIMESKAELEALANELNPVVGFWDPLALADSGSDNPSDFFSESAAIGYLRQAEIKHGRVAMAAFVGFIVQSNGIHFPWGLTSEISYADIAAVGGPAAQWDALPTASKLQIFGLIGFLEGWSENRNALAADGQAHYMKGGKPGYFPSFKGASMGPAIHPMPLDLFDPFGFSKGKSDEAKARGLKAEINNGRLAQIGIMAFVAESRVPGSVPGLSGLGIAPYSGEVMAPFSASDAGLPFVTEMLKYQLPVMN